MTWERLGRIFQVDGQAPWMMSHASLPTPVLMGEGRVRVFFASRDAQNRSHIGHFDFHVDEPKEILDVATRPHLAPGPLGHFDDHGVYPASIIVREGTVDLYYIGWSPGARPPLFYAAIGLARSAALDGPFERVSPAPVMQRGPQDPWMVTSPHVRVEAGRRRMWYVSGLRWEETERGLRSFYHIKHASSSDGIHWARDASVAIPLAPGESNLARPWVEHGEGGYRMWYSFDRGAGYQMGTAVSQDGSSWRREDPAAMLGPPSGAWDEQTAYPAVFRHAGRRFMLYCGNGFGRDGIGLAVEDEDT